MESRGAPADERIARRRWQPRHLALRRGVVWLMLLGGVLALQCYPLGWQVTDGWLRAAVQIGAWATGFALGWSGRLRDPFSWATWPPEGALYERQARRRGSDLALEWWRYLWAVPALVLLATMMASVALLAVVRPAELVGALHAGDVLWHGVIAIAVGDVLGREMGAPRIEAITARGVHLSPVSFARWGSLSHAGVDRPAGAIRLFARQRPWLPLAVMTFDSPAELEHVAGLIGEFLPLENPGEAPLGRRVSWGIFLGAWVALTAALSIGALLLLLLPREVLGPHWLAALFTQLPEATLAIALIGGSLLDSELAKLRGIRWKRIVSEAP